MSRMERDCLQCDGFGEWPYWADSHQRQECPRCKGSGLEHRRWRPDRFFLGLCAFFSALATLGLWLFT